MSLLVAKAEAIASSSMPRLTYTDVTGHDREAAFTTRATLGRHPAQDVQILDRVVSKEHAVIEASNGAFLIRDLGSRNGTVVNGRTIDGPTALQSGDTIVIGSTAIKFHATATPPPKSTSPGRPAVDSKRTSVTILDVGVESAIRGRVTKTANERFARADEIQDEDQLREDYEKLRIANELNRAVALEFDPDVLLERILEKAFEMFAADRGVILLMDTSTGTLVPAATRARSTETPENIRISRTILQEVIEEKNGVLSSDAQMDSRFSGSHSIVMQGIRATMSVPLLYRGQILGVIHLDSQLTANAFTKKDLGLLSGFASQAANAIEHARLVERAKHEALAREQLGRLLPQEVVDDVMAGRLNLQRGGDMRAVTVLFADLRGFTAMSERYRPQAIVAMLNEYFDIMVEIVFRHGGTLDKFIGDELMAVWGAPITVDDHCTRAAEAALEMQVACKAYNQIRSERGEEPVHIGVGMNAGEVVAGYMGSSRAMDYTIIGDVVNTASRLCSAANKGEIVVSEAVVAAIGPTFHVDERPPAMLKGKASPVRSFHLLGRNG